MKSLIVIPARYESSRFPGKPLKDATGWPLIRHVYEQAKKSIADRVIVATDDSRILECVTGFGGEAMLTKSTHMSGTDRIAEVVSQTEGFDVIVNLQGDEPEIEPEAINNLIELQYKYQADISTISCRFSSETGSPLDPNCVKVVLGKEVTQDAKYAIYFSRSPIPYPKATHGQIEHPEDYFLHIGMYAYSPASLAEFTKLPRGVLEQIESLEQLRALEHGKQILVGIVDQATPGVDTPEDYQAFVERYQAKQ